ncbi:MAG: energy transducer TonB [Chlorobi bacterium]|nr:energy transducer TonB [Chlorobiota bacterium]
MKIQITIIFLFLMTSSVIAQNDSIIKTDEEEMEIIDVVEQMPEFIGGFKALQKYVNSNTIYTEKARKEKVTGKVFVSFWVETDGSISDPKILRGLCPDLDSISIDLVKKMPKWIPAEQRGKPIKCRFNLPIEFNFDLNQNLNDPEPSKYWSKKGKKKFMKICTQEFRKNKTECDCWYNFIIWNYNNWTIKDLDIKEIFEKQKCE